MSLQLEPFSKKLRKHTNSLLGSASTLDPWLIAGDLLRSNVTSDSYSSFQQRYYSDPAGFATDCLIFPPGKEPAPYQLQALAQLQEHGRLCIRAPHSAGKTGVASWAVLWFALTRDGRTDWKVPMTASVWRQLTKFLLPEIHKWARAVDWLRVGRPPFSKIELQQHGIKLVTGEAFAVASDNPALIEGAHATSLLYVFDEAKSIRDETFDAAEGAFATAGQDTAAEAFALTLSTPGAPAGRFYDIQANKPAFRDWRAVHVTMPEAVRAGRMSQEWVDARQRQWGENNPIFITRVLGDFASDSENATIPLSWIEAAVERWYAWRDNDFAGRPIRWGVDVARFGSDMTYIALYKDGREGSVDKVPFGVASLEVFEHLDTMAVAGKTRERLHNNPGTTASIDTIGIGAGVFDRLKELGYPVYDYTASRKAPYRDKTNLYRFADVRSYSYWYLRELLDPDNGYMFCLPDHDDLTGDLAVLTHTITSDGLVRITSKDQLRKEIGRSTDAGDSVVIAMYTPPLRRVGLHL